MELRAVPETMAIQNAISINLKSGNNAANNLVLRDRVHVST